MVAVHQTLCGLLMMMLGWPALLHAEVLVDPTQPPGYRSLTKGPSGNSPGPAYVLSSTLIAPGRRLATINGKTVMVGQQVAGAKVLAIEPAHVALLTSGQQIIVRLLPATMQRTYDK